MVNITKPPIYSYCNNYNTIAKEKQEYQNLFPEVGPIDFSSYKRRTSTVNYDIIEVAKRAQLQLEALQNAQDEESDQEIINDSKEQAMQFQSLLEGGNANAKKSGKGVRFGISMSTSSEDDVPNEFIDYHIDDNEDKERLHARRLLFTTLRGARDSLVMIRPKYNMPEPIKFKKLIPEPEPINAIDILVQKLANIYLPFQPPYCNLKYIQEQSDVIVTVRKSYQIQDTERILCHSQILSKSSNAFKEMFDLYVWDMELQEKRDIHCATTTGWLVINFENHTSMILLIKIKFNTKFLFIGIYYIHTLKKT